MKLVLIPELYHLNEAHGVSSVFYLYKKFGNIEEVRKSDLYLQPILLKKREMKNMIFIFAKR